ncbi:hypothetical protein GTC6_19825 [Gordonia terrae C-6]|uniref:Uncharacterized protein n=1 Tax=Gordonia terrae C-6 TaxID=1316928 RepID=R7Y4J5_9ACTN|nr:hypothetical protein [Gordonia terrae]EON30973.1 hypothetical protein GTC6_19825 [Gordonia terrae C-6]
MPASVALREAVLHDVLGHPAFGTVPPVGARLVVAVGSNAAPDVLRRKLAHVPSADTICLRAAHVTNITVGHSAHVAARGYLPAAPVFAGQQTIGTIAAWLGPAHVAALDATEPNYHRQTVNTRDHPLTHGRPATLLSDDRPPLPTDFDLYVSRHGVLADPVTGEPLPFGPQADVLAWLSRKLDDVSLAAPASQVCTRLAADPQATTARIRAAGLPRPCGSHDPLPIGQGR